MKSIVKKSDKKAAFTIVELLTVMSIIVILIGLLVPALNEVRKYAKNVKQKAQFHAIGVALEFFNGEFQAYPDSSANGPDGNPYCGAMKLGEAMVGKDLLGFHPDSVFNSNGQDFSGRQLYNAANSDLSARKTYLDLDNANAYRIQEIYGASNIGSFDGESIVLCDVFGQVMSTTGQRIGMPILYYKAHPARLLHDVADPDNSIYDYRDNQQLVLLGKPWDTGSGHKLATEGTTPGARFYENTWNEKVTVRKPFNKDTYILISAGSDGEYGTADDICNFDFKYREM